MLISLPQEKVSVLEAQQQRVASLEKELETTAAVCTLCCVRLMVSCVTHLVFHTCVAMIESDSDPLVL